MANSDAMSLVRNLLIGCVAGAIAVAIFHQGMVLILYSLGYAPNAPYSMNPVKPWSVPTVFNQMFWGGVWGMVYALIVDRLPKSWPMILVGFCFGLIGPVLFGWTVMATIRGQAMFAGFVPMGMLRSVLINGCWGIGLALIFCWIRPTMGSRQTA